MSAIIQPDIAELLEQAGARPRGNRHDCPKCGGSRTITHTDETFFCHRCQWKGNTVTLAKELGIYQRLPSAEYRRLRQKRERAHEAALKLYSLAHNHQLELREELRSLGRLEILAHDAGPTEEAWNVLATVYAERPKIEAELDVLESGDPSAVLERLRPKPSTAGTSDRAPCGASGKGPEVN